MNNQLIQKTKWSLLAITALVAVFVLTQSVVAANQFGDFVTRGEGTVAQFQLAPTEMDPAFSQETDPHLNSLPEGTIFRVYGNSILADTVINENAVFYGEESVSVPSLGTLNAGYASIADVPNLAQLQVNGGIRVSSLASETEIGLYCLCANGLGYLERCGVYDPSIGETCEEAL